MFGRKEFSTKQTFINDTIEYKKADFDTRTNFGNVFFNLGVQYTIKLNKKTDLHLGAYGNLQQKLRGSKDYSVQTFDFDVNGNQFRIDSIVEELDRDGDVIYPATFGAGFMLEGSGKWRFGADVVTTNWKNYRFFGSKDSVQSNIQIKAGGEITPSLKQGGSYWSHVSYRAGVYYGTDYVKLTNNLTQFGFTIGMGLPVRKTSYTQNTIINAGLEFGRRSSGNNSNLKENFVRATIGFSLSDIWFLKPKYQ
jgi:hypothetical protein